ncbi:unnamed protein product [Prorocentrum cordatum]|nr:unnamed protein product [Polarella glacialis]
MATERQGARSGGGSAPRPRPSSRLGLEVQRQEAWTSGGGQRGALRRQGGGQPAQASGQPAQPPTLLELDGQDTFAAAAQDETQNVCVLLTPTCARPPRPVKTTQAAH